MHYRYSVAAIAALLLVAGQASAQSVTYNFEDGTDQGWGHKFSDDASEAFPIDNVAGSNRMRVLRNGDFQEAERNTGNAADPLFQALTAASANEAGYVDVDDGTLRHKKWANVWSSGDASSLPTSKTAAAITAQSPVLVRNLLRAMEGKEKDIEAGYDGYTSCPLLTGENKVMLAEFKYAGVPKETFGSTVPGFDQATPRTSFYYLKKDFFPWVYYKYMVKGQWGGPKGWIR